MGFVHLHPTVSKKGCCWMLGCWLMGSSIVLRDSVSGSKDNVIKHLFQINVVVLLFLFIEGS